MKSSRVSLLTLAIVCLSAGAGLAEAPGFPLALGGNTFGNVVIADFDGDGGPEIAVPVDNVAAKDQPAQGALHMVSVSGQALPGWPVRFPFALGGPSMAASDLQPERPGAELALGTSDGKLHLFTSQGTEAPGFPVTVGASCSRCLVADLNGDGKPELVAVAAEGKVFALDGHGQRLPGWPQTVAGGLVGNAEAADWDADGKSEVIVLDKDGTVHVLRGGGEAASVALHATDFCSGDFIPDMPGPELLVTNATEGTATLCDRGGRPLPGWPVKVAHASLPTPVRLSRDGPLYALVVDQAQSKPKATTNTIHLLGADGTAAPGWPAAPQFVAGYSLYSRPALMDVDGDGKTEIFFGHTCYSVVGLRADGSAVAGFPLGNVGMVYTTPALADLNGDQRYELVFADVSSIQSLHAFTLPYASVAWQVHQPTAAERERGFVLGQAVPFEAVMPDTPAVAGKLLERLELSACAGEYEPATFTLHALRDLEAVLRPGDLTAADGSRIPATALDARFVHVWRQRRADGPGEAAIPELLLKRDPGEMKGIISQPLTPEATTRVLSGTARQFWVTVHVPAGARPGVYEGQLTLTAAGATHPLACRLRVLPLTLPPNPFIHSIYFHGSSLGLGWYGEKEASREAWLQRARGQLADLREHGINACETYSPVSITTRGDEYTFDLENLSQSCLLQKEAGLGRWVVASLGYSKLDGQQLHPRLGAPFYRAYTALVRAVERRAQQEGWPPLSHYGVDEPMKKTAEESLKYYGYADPVDVCRQWFEAIRAGGGRTTSALYHTELGGWPILGPMCDVPIYSLGAIFPHVKPAELIAEMGQGCTGQAWYYWQCWTEEPIENRLLAGLYLCKSGLTGVMPWAYMAYNDDPYNDFDGPSKDMCIAYPSQEGPIPTVSWEAFREGVDDCRYWAAVKGQAGAQRILDRLSLSNSHNLATVTAGDLQSLRRELVGLARG